MISDEIIQQKEKELEQLKKKQIDEQKIEFQNLSTDKKIEILVRKDVQKILNDLDAGLVVENNKISYVLDYLLKKVEKLEVWMFDK